MMEDHQLSEIGLQHGSFFCLKKHIFCASCELLPDSWDVDDSWWFPNPNHHFSMSSAIGCHTKKMWASLSPASMHSSTLSISSETRSARIFGFSFSRNLEKNHHGGWLKNICSTRYLQGIGVIWDNNMNHTYDHLWCQLCFLGHMITLEGKNRQIPLQ